MDFWVTQDIQNSWIFQDAEKFKWWVDLLLMADEEGKIHMSLSDLTHRWRQPKTTVHRFLENLRLKPICGTKVERLTEHLMFYGIESYKGARNACVEQKRNADKESSPFPPAPPLSPKENINNSLVNNACTRERISWDEIRETGFREQFKAEGRLMASARKLGCDALGISSWMEKFIDHCMSSDLGHANIGHFGSHFNRYVEDNKSKPLQKSGQSTFDYNAQIALELGLTNQDYE